MTRPIPLAGAGPFSPSAPLAIGLFISAVALVALCAKRGATKLSKKDDPQKYDNHRSDRSSSGELSAGDEKVVVVPPKSPLRSPRRLLETISNKAIPFIGKKAGDGDGRGGFDDDDYGDEEGVWQRNILMGDKCRPLEFSGVIYYDNYGNRVPEMPRSPRAALSASPSPLHSFTFPVPKPSS